MWAIVSNFGLTPGLRAVRSSLLGVRRADRDVEGSVRVAEGGSEDVGGPKIGAREEARHLSLGGVVTGLGTRVNKCGDRVLASGGLAQNRWRGRRLCPGIQSGRQPKRKRTELTYSSGSSTTRGAG